MTYEYINGALPGFAGRALAISMALYGDIQSWVTERYPPRSDRCQRRVRDSLQGETRS